MNFDVAKTELKLNGHEAMLVIRCVSLNDETNKPDWYKIEVSASASVLSAFESKLPTSKSFHIDNGFIFTEDGNHMLRLDPKEIGIVKITRPAHNLNDPQP